MALQEFENMLFDTVTGEAISFQNKGLPDERQNPTGWFFEAVSQDQPESTGPDAKPDKKKKVLISPWGFASDASAQRLAEILKPYLPGGASIVGISFGDKNTAFPYSHLQREIIISYNGKPYRQNAGLLAQSIARTTFYDPVHKEIRQFPDQPVAMAIAELMRDNA